MTTDNWETNKYIQDSLFRVHYNQATITTAMLHSCFSLVLITK